jgi:hypothetical protein
MEQDATPFLFKAKPVIPETQYAPVESLDYDVSENVVYRTQQASRTPMDNLIHSCLKWLLCLLTGQSTVFTLPVAIYKTKVRF